MLVENCYLSELAKTGLADEVVESGQGGVGRTVDPAVPR